MMTICKGNIMKFGIVTLVGENYGNKYQNYAVEQLISEFGEIETYGLEELYQPPQNTVPSMPEKIRPSYIREALIARPMYRYDLNSVDRGIIHNYIYGKVHHNKLSYLRRVREERFEKFADENLHIAPIKLNRLNTPTEWADGIDFFICGSDQIWNPGYATTSELAFCAFAPEKTICLSPSFGVSEIPEYRKAEFAKWINNIKSLSVREEAGWEIIKELTGRDSELLLDPTMALPVEQWKKLTRKPGVELPKEYIVCYFLGRITKEYRKKIQSVSKQLGLPVVMLFDITSPEYYIFDPSEVLYTIQNATYVLTDSFHGTVFSILFKKDFSVFIRNEGAVSMNSRLETLLTTFGLKDRFWHGEDCKSVTKEQWNVVDSILEKERIHTKRYLFDAIQAGVGERKEQQPKYPKVYSGFLEDTTKIMRSASGGAATAISEVIIQQGGCVFGVAYTADFKAAEYICCETIEELEKIKGSKYTETKKNLPLLIQKLQEGRTVLFIGLGCDVASAHSYCKAKNVSTEKLYTIDILCHGPVPVMVHQRFVEDLEKKYRSKVASFASRSKRDGWSSSSMMKVEFENGRVYEDLFDDTDYGFIFTHYALPRCLNCNFKGSNHQGDLCLGDHWGISAKNSEWNKLGVSILIEQSEKGKELLNMLDEQFHIVQTDAQFAINHNQAYIKSRIAETSLKGLLQSLEKGSLHASLKKDTEYQKWKRKTKEIRIKRAILRVVRKNKNG